jgi:hypothetical protein
VSVCVWLNVGGGGSEVAHAMRCDAAVSAQAFSSRALFAFSTAEASASFARLTAACCFPPVLSMRF